MEGYVRIEYGRVYRKEKAYMVNLEIEPVDVDSNNHLQYWSYAAPVTSTMAVLYRTNEYLPEILC